MGVRLSKGVGEPGAAVYANGQNFRQAAKGKFENFENQDSGDRFVSSIDLNSKTNLRPEPRNPAQFWRPTTFSRPGLFDELPLTLSLELSPNQPKSQSRFNAALATEPSQIAFKTGPHVRILKAAIPLYDAPSSTKFTKQEFRFIAIKNLALDWAPFRSELHLDSALDFEQVVEMYQIRVLEGYEAIARLGEESRGIDSKRTLRKNRRKQLKYFGWLTHTLQDFYSHSNYLDLARDYFFPGKDVTELDSCKVPLFSDVLSDPQYTDFKDYLAGNLRTGIYPSIRRKYRPYRHWDMNIDGSTQRGFHVAFEMAVRETRKAVQLVEPHLVSRP